MTERAYLSIGDVLGLLREEFPDITISKIRFLESQGLLDPERTPSGYRKFYDGDVERLRWILHQQRENFLPLKVIKGRLEDDRARNGRQRSRPTGGSPAKRRSDPRRASADDDRQGRGEPSRAAAGGSLEVRPQAEPATQSAGAEAIEGRAIEGKAIEPVEPREPTEQEQSGHLGSSSASARAATAVANPPSRAAVGGRVRPSATETVRSRAEPTLARVPAGGADMTLEELASASGLSLEDITELETFGLVVAQTMGGTAYYDGESLAVACLAAGFRRFGVGARHLRSYKNAVERESGLFEQIVMPLLKQRNPESRQRAIESVAELSQLGAEMRAALLRRSLRGYSGG